MNPEDEFRMAMERRGLTPPRCLIADGRIRRCDTQGKPGKRNGAYLLHLDGRPRGGFENHTDGGGWEKWRANSSPMTPAEEQAWREKVRILALESQRARQREQEETAHRCLSRWHYAKECIEHPYLTRKGVKSYGLRTSQGLLLVPVVREGRQITSLQFINSEGGKRFAKGGVVHGGYYVVGSLAGDTMCIAEGYATAASIHEATGLAVAVAFNCGNLMPVAEHLRAVRPHRRLVICADNDTWTAENPGLTSARHAAQRVGASVAVPLWQGERGRGTDFNDLHASEGLIAVRRCVSSAIPPSVAK